MTASPPESRSQRPLLGERAIAQYLFLGSTLLVQAASLLLLPRALGTHGFALVAYTQAFALWLALIIEYGFSYSATRGMARLHEQAAGRLALVQRVRAAHLLLALLVLPLGLVAGMLLPLLREHPQALALGLGLAAAQGLTPWWYFQGREQVGRLVGWELLSAALTVGGWAFCLPSQHSAEQALMLQLVPRLLPCLIGQVKLATDSNWRSPDWRGAGLALREGWSLFVFMGSASLYTTLNVIVLGFYASAHELALFAAAEKLLRLSVRAWEPLNRLIYPLSVRRQAASSPHFHRRLFWLYAGLGIALTATISFLSPRLLGLLGPAFSDSLGLLHLMLPAVIMIALSNMLGILYLLTQGHDRAFNTVIIGAGAWHLLQSAVLAKSAGAAGMALSLLLTETLVAVTMLLLVWHYHRQHQKMAAPAIRPTPSRAP